MLDYIKKILPYPCTGAAYTIYSIADSKKIRKHVNYNGELDQFEIPVSILNVNGKLCDIHNFPQTIEGTTIIYYVNEDDNFCFRIE